MREANTPVVRPPLAGVVGTAMGHTVTPHGKPFAIGYCRSRSYACNSTHKTNGPGDLGEYYVKVPTAKATGAQRRTLAGQNVL